ncbi:cytochrome c-type biogenesis protein CcmH [candidate division KSB1 bacterium]|nr:cytochrome c-type biogenesis protein CcmH [candidate division KSB1 bacterium]NIR71178.1 cytochrome c-type biogenesis protein CcmH [candidate division KSB1 bacterium]NIS26159.1 cytochrome c-type biogenesis protein CcmH [candidate division KSB1 bacterium]NIT72924.1 cytochrome c-type biogenesis protein CcmH [candidate division KSB1 bacterium]NIU26798.1 cytochrome c-type biogenesis protein CcmH [candidate division KSB1 bacterium]
MRYRLPLIATCFLMVGFTSPRLLAQPQQVTVGEIKKSLVCLCDCNMTVEACEGSMKCQSAEQLTAEATQYIQQGLSKGAVLATFVGKYGEHILAAPTKRGFNLTAWILPFLGIFLAAVVVIASLRRWVRAQQNSVSEDSITLDQSGAIDPTYERTLDQVLHDLD